MEYSPTNLRLQGSRQSTKKAIKKKEVNIGRYPFSQTWLNYANKILSPWQSGFRQNHSTMSSLISNTDSWLVNIDAGLINEVIFLYLRNSLGPE